LFQAHRKLLRNLLKDFPIELGIFNPQAPDLIQNLRCKFRIKQAEKTQFYKRIYQSKIKFYENENCLRH